MELWVLFDKLLRYNADQTLYAEFVSTSFRTGNIQHFGHEDSPDGWEVGGERCGFHAARSVSSAAIARWWLIF
jgi:hypothetical protein